MRFVCESCRKRWKLQIASSGWKPCPWISNSCNSRYSKYLHIWNNNNNNNKKQNSNSNIQKTKKPTKNPMWSSVFNTKRKLFGCLKKNNSWRRKHSMESFSPEQRFGSVTKQQQEGLMRCDRQITLPVWSACNHNCNTSFTYDKYGKKRA